LDPNASLLNLIGLHFYFAFLTAADDIIKFYNIRSPWLGAN